MWVMSLFQSGDMAAGYDPGAKPFGLPSHTYLTFSPVGWGLQLQLLHVALLPRSQALRQTRQAPGRTSPSWNRASHHKMQ